MGGRNRRRWRHHDGPSTPPPRRYDHYPGYGHENIECQVPLWEREFCSYASGLSWQRFCENKQFSSIYNDIEEWDDSAALDNLQNAKSRFWCNYHGQPSDISLPDPDLYIEKVDHVCEVDPELVADLDKVRLPIEADNVFTVAANIKSENQSGNWDVYLEKPVEVNKWEEDNSRSNKGWGGALNNWNKNSSGWGDALWQPSWGSSSNNHCAANNWNNYHGASNRTYQDQRNAHGKKRNSESRNRAEDYQRGKWQVHSGSNNERFPFDNRPNGQRVERGF